MYIWSNQYTWCENNEQDRANKNYPTKFLTELLLETLFYIPNIHTTWLLLWYHKLVGHIKQEEKVCNDEKAFTQYFINMEL